MPGFLYSAVTYTLLGCKNVLCSWPIPAHPPTHPACPPPHHLARPPPPYPTWPEPASHLASHLARHLAPPYPSAAPPCPTRSAHHYPTWTHPARPRQPLLFSVERLPQRVGSWLAGRRCAFPAWAWEGRGTGVRGAYRDMICFVLMIRA